jgi:acetoin utilization deacetylase AcuC-like enzyme
MSIGTPSAFLNTCRVLILWHPDVLAHDSGAGLFDTPDPGWLEAPELHPENAERMRNMHGALMSLGDAVAWRDGRHATEDELTWLHDPDYLARMQAACATFTVVTKTTVLAPGSWHAVLAAAGTAIAAADAVVSGQTPHAYALVRPPGHHASRQTADGYCFCNNTALAAEAVRRAGVERVAIVDWDVHHGNGTQTLFYDRPDVLTVSFHMRHGSWGPSHPETGAPEEVGTGAGEGYNVNIELPLGSGDSHYLDAWDRIAAPIVRRFAPGVLLIASGQDANQFDPNGRQSLSMSGFRQLGARARALADEVAGGRLVMVQEGGYARTYSGACLRATIEGVLGLPASSDPLAFLPEDPEHARAAIERIRAVQSRYWEV